MYRRKDRRSFYVVQFTELPFEDIDDYVCVPFSWVIPQMQKKVVVTYPNDEDPSDTRDRVKRRERPNDKWRFYTAFFKYKSDDFTDAVDWIRTRNNHGPGEEESEIRDTQPETVLNRKLRCVSQRSSLGPNSDKPQLTVKRPLSQKPDKNLVNKHSKYNENAKPGISFDDETIAPECLKQERSVIITNNQLIQKDQTTASSTFNGETNTKHSAHPEVINESQPVDMSVQPTLRKLLAERQPSPQLLAKQQLSPQPPTEPQHSPKLTVEQVSQKLLAEQQPSPVGRDYKQPRTMSVIDMDEFDKDIESYQNSLLEPATEEITCTKTPQNILEQASQPESVNERSTQYVNHEHSLPEQHLRDVSGRQSMKPNDNQKTHVHRILDTPTMVPKPSSSASQPFQQPRYFQLPILPNSSTFYSKPKPQEMDERNFTIVSSNHQRPCSQDYMCIAPSTHHGLSCEKLSQLCTPVARNPPSVVKKVKHTVDKKTRLKGITKNISTTQYSSNSILQLGLPDSAIMQSALRAQNHLQQAQVDGSLVNNVRCCIQEKCVNNIAPLSQCIMDTSASQNLLQLAHQYRSLVGASCDQQYLPTQENSLQQLARIQDMPGRQDMARSIDQRVYQNAMINGDFVTHSQPNPIQFLPHTQYIPINGVYTQELIRGPIDGAHTTYKPYVQNGVNVQLAAHTSSNQSHQNSEHPQQKQDPPNYQDLCTLSIENGIPLKSKRPRSLSTLKTPSQALFDAQKSCLIQELGIHTKVNHSSTEYSNKNLAVLPENITVKAAPSTRESEDQTMLSSEQPHETKSILAQSKYVYRHPQTKKTMVDQATETDYIMDVDYCVNEMAGSPFADNTPIVVDSSCQTDERSREEQGSAYQETDSDPENATEHEIESEDEVVPEAIQTTTTTAENITPENQQGQSRIDVEQDMLSIFGTLLTQMGANLSFTRDLFNNLRNSILVCTQTYKTMLEKVDKFNSIEDLQVPTSQGNKVTSQVPQVNQEKTAGDNNKIGVSDAPTPIREQRVTFSLPAEYDPNDTKWTLKYQENKQGLVELLAQTGVYVNRKELKRCIRKSTDCRTLARLLLTEVFSKNALSVCSLNGGKAKAFKPAIDVRPGLDEHAKMVLLAFVEEHGRKHGWKTFDIKGIISSIQTKIYDMRAKHGQTCKISIV